MGNYDFLIASDGIAAWKLTSLQINAIYSERPD
jgi:hypothetical protein